MNRWRLRQVLFASGLIFAVAVCFCPAGGWSVTQLTNNDFEDLTPALSGANLAWCANSAGSSRAGREIMLYDGVGVTRLTENKYEDIAPCVSAEGVCWQGKDPGGDWEVFYYNASGTTQLTDNAHDDLAPKAVGGRVVWHGQADKSSEIFLYDGSSVVQLTDNDYLDVYPAVSRNSVAWYGHPDDWEIFVRDDGGATRQLTDNQANDRYPCFGDDPVFWRTEVQSGIHGYLGQVVMYDGNTTTTLTSGDALNDQAPSACGGRAAWRSQDKSKTYTDPSKGNYDIFLYTGSTVLRLTNDEYEDFTPVISEDFVVWSAHDGHDDEIFVFDGVSVSRLTDNDYDDESPCISGRTIAWVGYCGEGDTPTGEIFLATHTPEPGAVVLLLFGFGWLTRRGGARTIRRSHDYPHRRHG